MTRQEGPSGFSIPAMNPGQAAEEFQITGDKSVASTPFVNFPLAWASRPDAI
jgi:hypothetical protein